MAETRDLKTILQRLRDGWTAVGNTRRDRERESWWAVEHRHGTFVAEHCYAHHEDGLTRVEDEREWPDEASFLGWFQAHLDELEVLRPPTYVTTVDTIQFERLARPPARNPTPPPRPSRSPLTFVPSQQMDALKRPTRAKAATLTPLVRPEPPAPASAPPQGVSIMPLGLDPDRQPDPARRIAAAQAFGASGGVGEAMVLILALGDPSMQVRKAVAEALDKLGDKYPELALEALAATGGAPARLGSCHDPRAAWSLGALWQGARQARPELAEPEVLRGQALDALIAMGNASSAAPLMAILDDPVEDLARRARQALLALPAKPSAQL